MAITHRNTGYRLRQFEVLKCADFRFIHAYHDDPTMSNSTRLQLSLSAKGLHNLAGLLNTSDPFAVVTVRGDNPNNPPVIVGQTEV
jgi:hypothetical protein